MAGAPVPAACARRAPGALRAACGAASPLPSRTGRISGFAPLPRRTSRARRTPALRSLPRGQRADCVPPSRPGAVPAGLSLRPGTSRCFFGGRAARAGSTPLTGVTLDGPFPTGLPPSSPACAGCWSARRSGPRRPPRPRRPPVASPSAPCSALSSASPQGHSFRCSPGRVREGTQPLAEPSPSLAWAALPLRAVFAAPPSLWEQDWAPQVGAVGSACPQPSACTLAVPHAGEGCPPHTGRVGRAEVSVPLPTAAARRPWTGCSRPWGPGARPGSAPPASASRSRRCCAPASAPSTRRGGRPGTTSTARSPRRPSPSVSGAACPPDRSAGGVGRGQGGWWRS